MNLDLLIRKIVVVVTSFLLASASIAQDNPLSGLADETATLDITTVSGVRSVIIREETIQTQATPSVVTKTTTASEDQQYLLPSVDTISGAEIRTLQRYGLEDVLRQSAGVSVVQSGQAGAQTSLFIRGMESNHTTVLLNGRRLPPGLAGLYQLEYLDVSTLESVQFLRGGASSLYGADAIAGAIDLRSTDARFVSADTLSSYAEVGSFSTFRTGHKITIADDKLGVVLEGTSITTDNDRPSSTFDNGMLRANIAMEVGDGVYFDILGYVQNSNLQVAGSSLSQNFPSQQTNANQSNLLSPRISVIRDEWDFTAFYSYTSNDLEALMAPFFGDNSLNQVGREAEGLFNYRGIDDALFTLGAGNYGYEFDRSAIIPGPFNPDAAFKYSYASIFAQADVEILDGTDLLVSGRYDDHDTFESKGTYSAQIKQQIDQTGTAVFGKVSTGYKAPSGQDFIYLDPSVDPASLAPEESLTLEIGLSHSFFEDKASVSITYFQADIENLVDSTYDTQTFTSFPAVVDTETSGFEFEFRANPATSLETYVNYAYLDAEVIDGSYFGTYNPGDRLIRRPRHTLNAGVVVSGDKWKAGAEITGAYDRLDNRDFNTKEFLYVGDYTLARFFGSCVISDNVEIYGRIENTFDKKYEQTAGFAGSGVGAFAGVRIVLGK
jgi:vitamin B12 transporter